MNRAARVVSLLALIGTIVPALLFFNDRLDLAGVKSWMLAATIVWFAVSAAQREPKE